MRDPLERDLRVTGSLAGKLDFQIHPNGLPMP